MSATERVHDQPAQRRAALARGARRGEHDAAHREVEIGRRGDDRGVVAAELQQHPAEPLRDPRTDLLSHPHRTGRAQQRHPRIVDQALADLAPAHDQPAHLARRADIVGGALDQRLAGQRGQRRQLRRLPHHGVAAHQRDRGVPRPHRDREVERGDDADDAERMPGLHQPVPGPLGGDGLAVQLPRQADGELADVDHLLHLAEGLGGDLARLDGDQRGEIGLVLDEQLAEPRHQRAAHRCRGRAPRRERLRRFGDRGVGLLGVVSATVNSTSPVIGVLACRPWAPGSPSSTREPTACSAARAWARRSSAVGKLRCLNGGHDAATFS